MSVPALRARKLARLELPSVATVLERVRVAASSDRPRELLWELDELLLEADVATRAPVQLAQAFARAALASGTGFAVLTMARHPDLQHLPEAGVAFGAGVVGAVGAAYFGRLASARARKARAHWSGVARTVRRALHDEPNP